MKTGIYFGSICFERFNKSDLLFGVDILPPLTCFFGRIEGRERKGLKLAGDDRRDPAHLFPLQSIVCAGLPASAGSAVLFATGVPTGAAGGEFAAVAGEAGEPGFLARGLERGASAGMAFGAPRLLEAKEQGGGGTATKRDETAGNR
ncbi:MAG: hypothetical protein AAB654_01220 [Acidobacteriota bacterium]